MNAILQDTKHCSHCKQYLPLANFPRRSDRPNGCGYESACRACRREIHKQWRYSLTLAAEPASAYTHDLPVCVQPLVWSL